MEAESRHPHQIGCRYCAEEDMINTTDDSRAWIALCTSNGVAGEGFGLRFLGEAVAGR